MNQLGGAIVRLACVLLAACLLPTQSFATTGSWQLVRSVPAVHGTATDGTHYVAAADNGIWTSTDLKSWQQVALPSNAGLAYNDVLWDGSRFIAVGAAVIISSDGSTWKVVFTPGTQRWDAIGISGGVYVVGGSDGSTVLRSPDAVHWTPVSTGVTLDSGSTFDITGVGAGNGLFVVAGHEQPGSSTTTVTLSDIVMTSPDGLSWTQTNLHGMDFNNALGNDVAWGAGAYVIGGSGGVYASPDGASWTPVSLSNPGTGSSFYPWQMVRIQYVNGQFLAVGASSDNTGRYAAVFLSSDGTTWAEHNIASIGASVFSVSGIAYATGNYVVSGTEAIYSSTDLVHWTTKYSAPQLNIGTCLFQGGGEYVVPGNGGTLLSVDGSTWPDKLSVANEGVAGTLGPGCGTFANGTFVVIGGASSLVWSTDAINWTVVALSGSLYPEAVAWNGSEFLSLSTDESGSVGVSVSTDGKNWTAKTPTGLPTTKVDFGNGDFFGGGLVYANGKFFTWGVTAGKPFVATSADGQAWSQVSLPGLPTDATIAAVAYGNGLYVALGDTASGASLLFSSTDGSAWNAVKASLPDTQWEDLIWGDNQFLGVGGNNITGEGVVLESDSEGGNWQTAPLDDATFLYGAVWDGQKYVALSSYEIINLTPSSTGGSSGGGGGSSSGSGGGGGGSSSGSGGGGGGGSLDILALTLLSGLAIRRRERWTRH